MSASMLSDELCKLDYMVARSMASRSRGNGDFVVFVDPALLKQVLSDASIKGMIVPPPNGYMELTFQLPNGPVQILPGDSGTGSLWYWGVRRDDARLTMDTLMLEVPLYLEAFGYTLPDDYLQVEVPSTPESKTVKSWTKTLRFGELNPPKVRSREIEVEFVPVDDPLLAARMKFRPLYRGASRLSGPKKAPEQPRLVKRVGEW